MEWALRELGLDLRPARSSSSQHAWPRALLDPIEPHTPEPVDFPPGLLPRVERESARADPAEEPAAQEPAAEEPAAEEPVAEERAAEEPAIAEPAIDEPEPVPVPALPEPAEPELELFSPGGTAVDSYQPFNELFTPGGTATDGYDAHNRSVSSDPNVWGRCIWSGLLRR